MSAIIITQGIQPLSSGSSSSSTGGKNASPGASGISITSRPVGSVGVGAGEGMSETSPLLRAAPTKHLVSRSRFVVILLGVWSANFVIAFQAMAVPTMTPAVGSWFGHAELGSYLGSAFSLGNAAVIPVYGVFMDSLGRKFAMNTACVVFAIGTVLCAMSTSMYALIAARALAGLGGGGMLTVSSVIVTDLVPLRDRGLYQGLMMTIFGLGSMIGGPIAGHLVDQYGWHFAFWVQLPIVAYCITIVSLFLPPAPIAPTHTSVWAGLASLDWLGSILLIGSVTTLILGLSFHTSFLLPWSEPVVWGNLTAAVLAFALLIVVEGRVKRPIIPLGLFRDSHVAACMASGLFLSIVAQAFMYQIPMYFAVVLNTSNAQAGLILSLSSGFGQCVGSLWAGQHIRKGGKYRTMGRIALVPTVICAYMAARWTPGWSTLAYYASCAPSSFGYSVFLCVQLVALVSAVDSAMMPRATAVLYTLRTLGGTLGIAIGGSVQIGVLAHQLQKHLANDQYKQDIIAAVLHSKAAIRALPPLAQAVALRAYARSLSTVWVGCAVVGCVTMVSAWWIQEKEMGPVRVGRKGRAGAGAEVGGAVGAQSAPA